MSGNKPTSDEKHIQEQQEFQIDPSRRTMLKGMGVLGTSSLLGSTGVAEISKAASWDLQTNVVTAAQTSPDLEKFVDEFPRPGVLEPTSKRHGVPFYKVTMEQVEQKLHRDLPKTTVWGYNGQYPGPTIEAKRGKKVKVLWKNKLPKKHLLPVDTTVHGAGEGNPKVRTVTHLHGSNVEPESDGHPEAWFTRNFRKTGPHFEKKVYEYVNNQPATTLWYHDHALGITRLNVYAGLAGFYLLRDKRDRFSRLPTGKFEIPIVLQDRTFCENGDLFYPSGPDEDTGPTDPDPSVVPEFFGDTSVVNGKVWPKLTVKPRKYRFRLLDGANSRFYNLKLLEYDTETGNIGGAGPTITQIGSDGGFLKRPVDIEDRLLLGPGMRADVIVDFSGCEGQSFLLHNNAPSPFSGEVGEGVDDAQPLPEIMRFDVADKKVRDKSHIPKKLARIPKFRQGMVDTERDLTLVESTDQFDRLELLLGTQDSPNGLRWDDPITENPRLDTTEQWNLINLTPDTHPIHLHLVQFQVLGRQAFDVEQYQQDVNAGNVQPIENYYVGDPMPPEPNERGWKDTISANPGEVTWIITHFGKFDGLFSNFTGEYVWHCHILEHEDHEMMRPYEVRPPNNNDGNDNTGNGC